MTSPRRLLAERAYEALKSSLQGGDYPPGTFLSERQLAARLGMSKTPLKSALVRLEAEGFLRISPQQGIIVREPSVQEIGDLFDFREAIEGHVARRLAAKGLSEEQVARLRTNLAEQERAVRRKDVAGCTSLDTEFHMLLAEFLGNRELIQSLTRLREKLNLLILGNLSRHPERMATSTREHAAIAAALQHGKGSRAEELVRGHLEYGRKLILGA